MANSFNKILAGRMAILFALVLFAACSSTEDDIVAPDVPDNKPEIVGTRDVKVRLLPQSTSRTELTLNAELKWSEGDRVAYYTSIDGNTWATSREAVVDNMTGRFTATSVPTNHKWIRVVYPSPGEGKEYAKPQVEKNQTVTLTDFELNVDRYVDASQGIDKSANNRCMMAGKYLPMEAEPTEIPDNNEMDAVYTVLGAVIKFNLTLPASAADAPYFYGIKAIKAGDYLFHCQVNWSTIDSYNFPDLKGLAIDPRLEIDEYSNYPFCVVVPVGENIDYTPTVYAERWDTRTLSNVDGEYGFAPPKEMAYTRNVKKTDKFTAKAYDITLDFTDPAKYTATENGWINFDKYGIKEEVVPVEDDYVTKPVTTYYRYGYSHLDDNKRMVYDYILSKLYEYEDNADFYNDIQHRAYLDFNSVGYNMTLNDLMYFLEMIKSDVPEVFHLGATIPRYDSQNKYYARINKVWPPDRYHQTMQTIDAQVNEFIKGIKPSMSDFEKIKLIHDRYLVYAHYGGMSDANGGNLYGGIINKKAVCEGLSRTFLYLCQKVGLKCIYIVGIQRTSTTTDPTTGATIENWGSHAWNHVEIDGKWYMVDMSSDGGFWGSVGYEGFLRGKTRFDKDHKMEDFYDRNSNPNLRYYPTLPELTEDDYPCTREPFYYQ